MQKTSLTSYIVIFIPYFVLTTTTLRLTRFYAAHLFFLSIDAPR